MNIFTPVTRSQRIHSKVGRGFTLIELLVVIAIIAILAAILFPVFARARENARRATCQSNLKQIGLGLMQYSQDYDETYPLGYTREPFASAGYYAWNQLLTPYTTVRGNSFGGVSPLIMECPDDATRPAANNGSKRSYALAGATLQAVVPTQNALSGYGDKGFANLGFAGTLKAGTSGDYISGRNAAEIQAAANTLMVVEMPGFAALNNVTDSVVYRPVTPGAPNAVLDSDTGRSGQDHNLPVGSPQPLHSEGWDYLFCDGHVKWLRPEATIGTGVNLNGQCYGSASTGYSYAPCNMKGMWTLDPND